MGSWAEKYPDLDIPQKPEGSHRYVIYSLNDVYDLLLFPYLKTFIDEHRAYSEADEVHITLNGDFLSPSTLSIFNKGEIVVKSMNALGVTHVCFGNHEFDVGWPLLGDRMHELNAITLNSNMAFVMDNTKRTAERSYPYIIHTLANGAKVSYTGYLTEETYTNMRIILGDKPDPVTFTDAVSKCIEDNINICSGNHEHVTEHPYRNTNTIDTEYFVVDDVIPANEGVVSSSISIDRNQPPSKTKSKTSTETSKNVCSHQEDSEEHKTNITTPTKTDTHSDNHSKMPLSEMDFSIALTHQFLPYDRELAAKAVNVDLILGGHEHEPFAETFVRVFHESHSRSVTSLSKAMQINKLDRMTSMKLDVHRSVEPVYSITSPISYAQHKQDSEQLNKNLDRQVFEDRLVQLHSEHQSQLHDLIQTDVQLDHHSHALQLEKQIQQLRLVNEEIQGEDNDEESKVTEETDHFSPTSIFAVNENVEFHHDLDNNIHIISDITLPEPSADLPLTRSSDFPSLSNTSNLSNNLHLSPSPSNLTPFSSLSPVSSYHYKSRPTQPVSTVGSTPFLPQAIGTGCRVLKGGEDAALAMIMIIDFIPENGSKGCQGCHDMSNIRDIEEIKALQIQQGLLKTDSNVNDKDIEAGDKTTSQAYLKECDRLQIAQSSSHPFTHAPQSLNSHLLSHTDNITTQPAPVLFKQTPRFKIYQHCQFANMHEIQRIVPPCPVLLDLYEQGETIIRNAGNKTLYRIPEGVTLSSRNVRAGPNTMANFLADCIREAADVDVVLLPSGKVRANKEYLDGTVKMVDIMSELPFPDNQAVILEGVSVRIIQDIMRFTNEYQVARGGYMQIDSNTVFDIESNMLTKCGGKPIDNLERLMRVVIPLSHLKGMDNNPYLEELGNKYDVSKFNPEELTLLQHYVLQALEKYDIDD